MALDYRKIRKDKEQEYGTKVGNYGRLLANLYSDRAHFIFELLQNAEDALKERGAEWAGSRAVSFNLTKNELRFNHFGRPFDETDVRGICEIGESAKADDLTAIGRFGIGFKSVYAITERPEIHSGPEDFAIENFVLPVAVSTIERPVDNTVFLFPLKSNGGSIYGDIATGLVELGASSLLFLHQIDEVEWQLADGRSGHYLRESETIDEGVQHITVIGRMSGAQDVSLEWLVFSRPVPRDNGGTAGQVEIAFFLDNDKRNIRPVSDSRLVVFFPTTIETHLGFLMQGPYQTTPSRDNVPPHAPWNRHLVEETAILLQEGWLRDRGDSGKRHLGENTRTLSLPEVSKGILKDPGSPTQGLLIVGGQARASVSQGFDWPYWRRAADMFFGLPQAQHPYSATQVPQARQQLGPDSSFQRRPSPVQPVLWPTPSAPAISSTWRRPPARGGRP